MGIGGGRSEFLDCRVCAAQLQLVQSLLSASNEILLAVADQITETRVGDAGVEQLDVPTLKQVDLQPCDGGYKPYRPDSRVRNHAQILDRSVYLEWYGIDPQGYNPESPQIVEAFAMDCSYNTHCLAQCVKEAVQGVIRGQGGIHDEGVKGSTKVFLHGRPPCALLSCRCIGSP